jgi:hypothetical protein
MIQVGKPVTGSQLIGRDQELSLIKELLVAGQSVVLIAPRRMGKTSVLTELLAQLKKEGFFTVSTDVFVSPNILSLSKRITESVLANRKLDTIFRTALTSFAEAFKNIKFRTEVEDFSFILDYNQTGKPAMELLEKSIDFIDTYAKKHKQKSIAAFDEFGDIKKLDGKEIVKLFRAKIQHQQNTAYLFTGSYESVMHELFVSKNAPFFRMARIINLDNIASEYFMPYLIETVKKEGLSIEPVRLKEILDFTKGHPYYTQLYLQEMMIQLKIYPEKKIVSHQEMIDQLLLIEKNYLEKYWEELSSSRELRQICLAVAISSEAIYTRLAKANVNIARGLTKLKGKGILNTQGQIADPLFKEWLRVNIIRE